MEGITLSGFIKELANISPELKYTLQSNNKFNIKNNMKLSDCYYALINYDQNFCNLSLKEKAKRYNTTYLKQHINDFYDVQTYANYILNACQNYCNYILENDCPRVEYLDIAYNVASYYDVDDDVIYLNKNANLIAKYPLGFLFSFAWSCQDYSILKKAKCLYNDNQVDVSSIESYAILIKMIDYVVKSTNACEAGDIADVLDLIYTNQYNAPYVVLSEYIALEKIYYDIAYYKLLGENKLGQNVGKVLSGREYAFFESLKRGGFLSGCMYLDQLAYLFENCRFNKDLQKHWQWVKNFSDLNSDLFINYASAFGVDLLNCIKTPYDYVEYQIAKYCFYKKQNKEPVSVLDVPCGDYSFSDEASRNIRRSKFGDDFRSKQEIVDLIYGRQYIDNYISSFDNIGVHFDELEEIDEEVGEYNNLQDFVYGYFNNKDSYNENIYSFDEDDEYVELTKLEDDELDALGDGELDDKDDEDYDEYDEDDDFWS